MTLRSVVFWSAALAGLCFVPGVTEPVVPAVHSIDQNGVDAVREPSFAFVEMPRRDAVTPLAPLHDLAYAAADAGPEGCLWILGGVILLAVVTGLWTHGIRGALRRVLLSLALGVPICLTLLYTSCLLDGRLIRLGPDAAAEGWVPASLHVHTDVSTGLLSPRQVVVWHWKRRFRVLNVSDRDSIRGGVLAREAYRRMQEEKMPFEPPMVITVGDEWHGQPDIVFVNTTSEPPLPPEPPEGLSDEERHAHRLRHLAELANAVHAEGGALFLAHPWSKVPGVMTLEEIFRAGLDGVEVFNGVIHGGEPRVRAAVDAGKQLFGVIDYKFGPHVNAMTLLDERLARTPEGVAEAVRSGRKLVLYAVPGGPRTSEEWKAAEVGLKSAGQALDSLFRAPLPRRGVWLAWGVLGLGIWWLATRNRPGLGKAAARTLFVLCGVAQLLLHLFVWFRVRAAVGVVPVPYLLVAHAVLAVPLLVANHSLALLERHR